MKTENSIDHSDKSILIRGCDPEQALKASKMIPPLIGNPYCIGTTNDHDFIEQLKSRQWTIVFFAPGACRFNAAGMNIPGGNSQTNGWTLEEYRKLVYDLQGDAVKIVETPYESETVRLLLEGLEN